MSLETVDGRLIVIAGASRSGKTAWAAKQVGTAPRAIAWDVEDQWGKLRGWRRVSTRAELFAACQKPGPARLAYVAGGDIRAEFDYFCGCAMFWGRYHGPAVVVAEELADVTSQAKAPGNWGILLRRGLKRGISIYAVSQRWAEADKTAIGNASEYVCFSMRPRDVVYMADVTGLDRAELVAMKPVLYPDGRAKLLPFVRVSVSGEIERGRLKF